MSENSVNARRRNFLIGATSLVGAAGVAGVAVPFIGSWNPSAKALAAGAPIKVDVSKLAAGEILGPIPAWRDKPIFVVKRSEAQLDSLNSKNGRAQARSFLRGRGVDVAGNANRHHITKRFELLQL